MGNLGNDKCTPRSGRLMRAAHYVPLSVRQNGNAHGLPLWGGCEIDSNLAVPRHRTSMERATFLGEHVAWKASNNTIAQVAAGR